MTGLLWTWPLQHQDMCGLALILAKSIRWENDLTDYRSLACISRRYIMEHTELNCFIWNIFNSKRLLIIDKSGDIKLSSECVSTFGLHLLQSHKWFYKKKLHYWRRNDEMMFLTGLPFYLSHLGNYEKVYMYFRVKQDVEYKLIYTCKTFTQNYNLYDDKILRFIYQTLCSFIFVKH